MQKTLSSPAPKASRRSWRRILLILAAIVLSLLMIGAVVFYLWANDAAEPMPEAVAALMSDEAVTVRVENGWLIFEPTAGPPSTAFIFYPGGKVDHRAYAPMLQAVAQEGYLAATTDMPLNLAFFGINKADDLVAGFPDVDRWIIGGHSLGGVAAARYARTNPAVIDGLALWASLAANSDSLADREDLAVVSIYGTNDGLLHPEEIEGARELLPPQTMFVPIEGGNHAQFGWYGEQSGDNVAAIDRLTQQEQIIAATLLVLEQQLE